MSRRAKASPQRPASGRALADLSRTGRERPFPAGKVKAASFGGGSSIAFSDTILSSGDRGNVLFLLPTDSRFYLTGWTRYRINQKVEWLWQNFGIVKELGAGIARHTVGKGIVLVIDSTDHEYAMAAEADFADYAASPDRCDVAGRRDFYDAQNFAIRQYLYRGEFFAAHRNNPRWNDAPAFQIYDSQEVTSPDRTGDDVVDGVKCGQFGEAVEYYVRTLGDDMQAVPAALMMHWFDAHAANQVRGISHFAQAVNALVDIHELQRLEARTAKVQKLVALVLKGVAKKRARGAMGAIEKAGSSDPDVASSATADLEKIYGGAGAGIAYLDADGDAKLINSNSPSPLTEEFVTNMLMRDVTLAPGVPMEFFWNIGKLGSAGTRFINVKADLFFQVTADALASRFCTPLAWRYLQSRIASRKLQKPRDPNWRITWQFPRRVTIDNGHDTDARLADLAAGATTLKEIYGDKGENWIPQTRQWIRECLKFIEMAKAEGATPAMIERWEANMPLWRAAMPGASANDTGKVPNEEDPPPDDPKKPKKSSDPDA